MAILAATLALFGIKRGSAANENDTTNDMSSSKPNVLIIDDDAKFLETMRILLLGAGYNVLTSTTGPKGLDMMRYAEGDINTVVLDFNMPGFSGADTLEYLHKLNPRAKVIAVSGLKECELPITFQKSVNRFIAKPFSNGELLKAIQEMVGRNAPAISTST